MYEPLLYALLGVGCGTFCGLIPGVHPNNMIPITLTLAFSLGLDPLWASVFLVCAGITNTFVAYIPSTFLGVPEEGTALSVLPAHRLVREGKGYQALRLSASGCLFGLLVGLLLFPLFFLLAPQIYGLLSDYVGFILIGIACLMLYVERSLRKVLWGLLIFTLAGLLGRICLSGGLCPADASLVPLFSGLFGLSTLLLSLQSTNELPPQSSADEPIQLNKRTMGAAGIVGSFMGMLPAVGPAQTTTLAQAITRSETSEEFLLCLGEVNLLKVFYSIVLLYLIHRTRTGIAAGVGKLLQVDLSTLLVLISACIFAGGLATLIVLRLGKFASIFIPRFPYRFLVLTVSLWVTWLSFYCCGPVGLVILSTATAIGMLPPKVGVRRVHCMGCLMLPVILSRLA